MEKLSNIRNLILRFVILSIILLPFFNDFPLYLGHSIFRSPSIYPLIISVLLFIIVRFDRLVRGQISKLIKINVIYLFLIAYLGWCFFTGLVNFNEISKITASSTSGPTVFYKNIILLVLYVLIAFATSYSFSQRNKKYYLVRKACLYSFVLMMPYLIIEILALSIKNTWSMNILKIIEPIIHARVNSGDKIRGFAFEASYLSLYLAFVFPWILGFVLENRLKKKRYVLLLAFYFGIVALSNSRIILLVTVFEFGVYILFVFRYDKRKYTYFTALVLILITGIVMVANLEKISIAYKSLFKFEENEISNTTRAAGIQAAMLISLDRPVFGVGYGLSGAHIPDYYPEYAYANYLTPGWIEGRDEDLSAPAFAMIPKIAAEVGFPGLFLFLMIWLLSIKKVFNKFKLIRKEKAIFDYFGISIIAMIVGLFIGSFGVDGYNFLGYWIGIGLAASY